MSLSQSDSDAITPMPRTGQDHHYFNHEDVDTGHNQSTSQLPHVAAPDDADEILMAQQELVARALTPDISMSSWTNLASLHASPDRRLHRGVGAALDFAHSDSALSSRPGTPHTAPSNLPIPSNPSSYPEDQAASPGPSLVMPQIQILQRRPYTENGRKVGKLRVIFCGDSGSGKTTLLRTMLDRSPDVVHCENTTGSEPGRATTEINDVRASTQPYPSWRILFSTTRQDDHEPIMERNLCLIDTPGYGLSAETHDAIDPILRYVEDQFIKTNDLLRENINLNDDDFLSLIAAPQGGFTQIDAAIYCVTKELAETDCAFINGLSRYTTVIPVITKSDKHDVEALNLLRKQIKKQLSETAFQFFEMAGDHKPEARQIYAVSCRDPQIEASIMMADSYSPNLVPSDLDELLSLLLHQDQPPRLRHYTARKFLAWKSRHQYEQSLICRPESELGTLLPSADFTVSRIAEHTKSEDKKSQLRIAAWASEMRHSFALSQGKNGIGENFTINEKSAEWLITRMNDYVVEEKRTNKLWKKHESRQYLVDESDPLGLLRVRDRWSKRLKKAFKWCLDLGFSVTGVFLCYSAWQRMSFV